MEPAVATEKTYAKSTKVGTCALCNREKLALLAGGLCGRCYTMRRKGLNDTQIIERITDPNYNIRPRKPKKLSTAVKLSPTGQQREVTSTPPASPALVAYLEHSYNHRRSQDRKIQIDDTIYVFRVPKGTSLDAVEIISNGVLLMIKVGMKPGVDVWGKFLNTTARSWNAHQAIKVDVSGRRQQLEDLLGHAVVRSKNAIEAALNYKGDKLYQLSTNKHNGETIHRDDTNPMEPYYYINATTRCDNCGEAIKGRTRLEINKAGKVAKAFPFQADEPVVPKPFSKKLLHERCAAVHVEVGEAVPVVPLEAEAAPQEEVNEEMQEWMNAPMGAPTTATHPAQPLSTSDRAFIEELELKVMDQSIPSGQIRGMAWALARFLSQGATGSGKEQAAD